MQLIAGEEELRDDTACGMAARKYFNRVLSDSSSSNSHKDVELASSRKNPLTLQPTHKNPDVFREYENQYLRGRVAIIDDLLAPEALRALRAFLLEATIWRDPKPSYLGAYWQDGMSSPVLLQVVDALRKALPTILGVHHLEAMWAYAYDNKEEDDDDEGDGINRGIQPHVDSAAVNVNLWLTENDACECSAAAPGGLEIWPVRLPLALEVAFSGTESRQGWHDVQAALAREGVHESVRVPYACNRAVVFDSGFVHRTEPARFKPGHRNRRINLTFLFGHRETPPDRVKAYEQ